MSTTYCDCQCFSEGLHLAQTEIRRLYDANLNLLEQLNEARALAGRSYEIADALAVEYNESYYNNELADTLVALNKWPHAGEESHR